MFTNLKVLLKKKKGGCVFLLTDISLLVCLMTGYDRLVTPNVSKQENESLEERSGGGVHRKLVHRLCLNRTSTLAVLICEQVHADFI